MPTLRSSGRQRTLDAVDQQLLALVRDDARTTVVALGRTLHLGHATVHARLRRLEQEGYIRGYHAALDYARLGLGLSAFVGIQMPQAAAARRRLIEHLSQIPEVEELVWVTGEFDALLRIRARDTVHLQEAVFRTISAGGGQVRTRTMVVLSEPYWRPGPAFEAVAPEGAAEDGDA